MAYNVDPFKESQQSDTMSLEDDNQVSEGSQPSGEGMTSTSVSGAATGDSGGSQAPSGGGGAAPRPTTQKGSGAFTNIGKYIEQNKPKAQEMADKAIGDVQQRKENIGQQIQKRESDFARRIAENRARMQQAQDFTQNQLSEAVSTPSEVTEEETQRFRDIATGRERFDILPNLDIKQQELESERLSRQTEGIRESAGRGELLRDIFNTTRGQSLLDEAIVQSDTDVSKNLISSLQDPSKELSQQIREAKKKALSDAAGIELDQKSMQQLIDQRISEKQRELQTQADEGLITEQQMVSELLETSETPLTEETLSTLGIDPNQALYGVDIGDYIKDLTLEQSITPELMAKSQVLSRLAGREQDLFDPLEAGTSRENVENLKRAIEEGKINYEATRGNMVDDLINERAVARDGYGNYNDMGHWTKWLGRYVRQDPETGLPNKQDLIRASGLTSGEWWIGQNAKRMLGKMNQLEELDQASLKTIMDDREE